MIIRSPPQSLSFKGQVTKHITVKRSIVYFEPNVYASIHRPNTQNTHGSENRTVSCSSGCFSRVPSLKFQTQRKETIPYEWLADWK